MDKNVSRKPKPAPKWLMAARQNGATPGKDWLSRALSRAGLFPFRESDEAIVAGRVMLDGQVVKVPVAPVTEKSMVHVDGRPVSLAWQTRVLQFHKPKGVVTHGHDTEGVGTVFEALNAVLPLELRTYGWHAVGRLDRDTTGLLLFTNDEKFVAHATAPATHLPKTYVAHVGGVVTQDKLERLRRGVRIDDGEMTRPAKAAARGENVVELTLTEGRFHQVKRMLNAVGLPTLTLHREAVGGLTLDVPEGGVRALEEEEIRSALSFEPRRASI